MKVAYFSPLPPDTSGIADYSALLLPALERLVEVEVVRPGRTRPVADADVALYHVGNNPDAHGWIVDALRRRPGVVVLHEFVVHHLVAGLTIGRRDPHAYLAAMEREAGVGGRLLGWGVLEGRVPPLWEVRPTEFPLAASITDLATGVVVHSRYVEALLREHGYDRPLWRIPHPAWPAPAVEPAAVDGSPLFGSFGHVNESKRVPQLLRAFAAFRDMRPGGRLLLVGAEAPGFDLVGRLERLGLDRAGVVREPYVEEERLWSLLAACDACVLLRAPTMGETSGSVVRALSLGKPVIVSDVGWFAELPDEVALKVPPGGDAEVAALEGAFERLAQPGVAARMGEAALAYARTEHDVDRVAERYVAALEQAAGGRAVDERVAGAVAAAAADVGVDPALLAPELANVGLLGPNGHGPERHVRVSDTRTRSLRAVPMWAWLCSLYSVAAVVVLALGLRVVSPWIMVDELIYADMARSFADTGRFLLRGVHANYGFVYPLLISPAYAALGPTADVYRWVHVINALVICSVVFPTYLLARRVVRPWYALGAAALAVAVPPLVYAGTIMTENAFYPIFMWAAWALVAALETPTLRRQLVLLAVCGLAFVTRAQAVAVLAAAVTAPLLLAWIERGRPRRLRVWAPLYGIVAAAVVIAGIVQVARGRSLSELLGGYSATTSTSYHAWDAFRWIVYHVAALDLALWIVPFAALVVLVANARHLDRPLRVFAAAAATLTVWLTLEVGVFASTWSQRIEERNLFYVAPLLLVALLAWLERGQPRPPRAAVAAAGVAAVLPGVIPFQSLMNINAQSDTPFLQPWWYLGDVLAGRENVALVAVAVGAALAAAFLWLPRRFGPLLPVLVAAGFLATWAPLELWIHSFPRLSAFAYENGISAGKSWIDAAVGRDADVTVVWSGDNPYRGWENEFWNRSIRRVYDIGATTLMFRAAEPLVTRRAATGALVLPDGKQLRAQYVLAEPGTQIVGKRVAADDGRGLVLYRVDGPVHVASTVKGWYPDRWTGPTAVWQTPHCTGGTLVLPVHSDPRLFAGVTQRITVRGTTTPFAVVRSPAKTETLTVPLQPVGGTCRITLHVDPARRPADFPALHNADPRRLGVLVDAFRYVPPAGS